MKKQITVTRFEYNIRTLLMYTVLTLLLPYGLLRKLTSHVKRNFDSYLNIGLAVATIVLIVVLTVAMTI